MESRTSAARAAAVMEELRGLVGSAPSEALLRELLQRYNGVVADAARAYRTHIASLRAASMAAHAAVPATLPAAERLALATYTYHSRDLVLLASNCRTPSTALSSQMCILPLKRVRPECLSSRLSSASMVNRRRDGRSCLWVRR